MMLFEFYFHANVLEEGMKPFFTLSNSYIIGNGLFSPGKLTGLKGKEIELKTWVSLVSDRS